MFCFAMSRCECRSLSSFWTAMGSLVTVSGLVSWDFLHSHLLKQLHHCRHSEQLHHCFSDNRSGILAHAIALSAGIYRALLVIESFSEHYPTTMDIQQGIQALPPSPKEYLSDHLPQAPVFNAPPVSSKDHTSWAVECCP